MIQIEPTTDTLAIHHLAKQTWFHTYADILSLEQINFMFDTIYSLDNLATQLRNPALVFLLAKASWGHAGFAWYEINYQKSVKTRVHKLYILPQCQGEGLGSAFINYIADQARLAQNNAMTLNVHRKNKAVQFYKNQGFEITDIVDIPFSAQFVLNDYVMEKRLLPQPCSIA